MKKKLNSLILGVQIIMLASTPILAANATKNISATYRNIKININGTAQTTDQEPFIYNNSTYVPLRFVAEKLDNLVTWDDATSTISINQESNADGDALKAIQKAKAFCGDAYDVYRSVEVLYINNTLFYRVEATKGSLKENIYYNTSDSKLYSYENNKLAIFQ